MKSQPQSMSKIIQDDKEYGLWFPKGISEYHLHIMARYIYVHKESNGYHIFYFNGKRVRTPRESSSHPCYNCGHCVDNSFATCANKKCIKDRRKRGLCEDEWRRSGYWIHTFEHTYTTKKKGVIYRHGWCKQCLKKYKWLGDFQCDFHVIMFKHTIHGIRTHTSNSKLIRNAVGELRHLVLKRDRYKCCDCGATKDEIKLEIDHIVPFSKGGLTELDNLQTLCKKCNRSKHTRTWRGGE